MNTDVRILVVDDSRAIREFVVQAISSWEGFDVIEATDGARGLRAAVANHPDLILLDLEMPRMDGFQVLDALHKQRIDIPVILITSHGSEDIVVEVFRKGVKDYLSKPFTADAMQDAIERALTEVRLRREKEALTENLAAANRQLRRRVQEMDTLYGIGKSITSLLSRDQVLERILDAVFYVIGPEEASLMLVDEASGRLRTAVQRQRVAGEVHQTARRTAEELAEEAARKGDATASGAMLYAPLMLGERVVGALGLGNRVSSRPFSGHERQLLLAMADYAAIAIENARLYEEVREADRAKSEFVSFVAHELRTPMTSIRGYADLLMAASPEPLAAQQQQFVRVIRNNVVRMNILVSDLQDVSRIETGHLQLEVQPTNLMAVLEDALQATQAQIEARSQRLALDVPPDLPRLRADPARLVQVLINLLSNAQKYTPEGGQIRVRAWMQDGFVHCAVSDTGIGMSAEDQACLFAKFFRSDDPAVQEMPGTGLGLCIVKSLVELQGGRIDVKSQLGKGTSVRFTVPLATGG